MENKKYFEIALGNNFERAFQLSSGEYLLKYTIAARDYSNQSHRLSYSNQSHRLSYSNQSYRLSYSNQSHRGILTIEKKSDIPVFVKIKIYRVSNQDCVLTRSSVLQTGQGKFEVQFDNSFNYGSGPFICSVKVTRYDTWQNIQDSARKMNATNNVTGIKNPTTESRLDDLSSNMKRLLEQGELSDVILVSDGGSNELRAHKLILSARSKVFSKMFQHSMKENRENRVTITDVRSEVLKELLIFIYTGVATVKDMKMARDLYVAADKYDVKELQAVCSKNLKSVDLDSVLDTLVLADLYGDKFLKQSALDFISANYSRVKAHKKWERFMKENQVLGLEVLSFVLDNRA